MDAHIVIGLAFGDEGKGTMVDYLSSKLNSSIVVRFSGGQQCGHNVIKDGLKHVFSNFGSGTLQNVPSYFSEHTTIYLNTISVEKNILQNKGIKPKLYVHPLTKLTTPYDIAYNRLIEKITLHGSCGLGVAATMKRNINTGYKLTAIDITYKDIMIQKLENIKKYYINLCDQMNLTGFLDEYLKYEEDFYNSLNEELFEIKEYDFLKNFENIIFEGSQGIMLDMDHGIFPNVTYAYTTSRNAIEICNILNIKSIETYYVTRCYQTRHGNGWMSNNNKIDLINNEEEINELNEFQGNFRIGEIDYDLLNYALSIDKIYNNISSPNIVVTCLDQRLKFNFNYKKINMINDFGVYESYSPESKYIKFTLKGLTTKNFIKYSSKFKNENLKK